MLPSSGIVPFHSEPDSISFGLGLRVGSLGRDGSNVAERTWLRCRSMEVPRRDIVRWLHVASGQIGLIS
jgi:hypothetical protein